MGKYSLEVKLSILMILVVLLIAVFMVFGSNITAYAVLDQSPGPISLAGAIFFIMALAGIIFLIRKKS